jgi:hypothetical protein
MSLADLSPTKALKSFASMPQKYNARHPPLGQKSLPGKPCQKNALDAPSLAILTIQKGHKIPDFQSFKDARITPC